ncbi:MAG: BON domain-containing protein [Candidatus Omnitrophica bacterium]|nr:BON domain-containing protein [Candidatus Omnitrophota bacterium]
MSKNYFKMFFSMTVAVLLFSSVLAYASEMDARIESSAKQSYVFKTYLKNDSIKIQSMDGAVTLTGTVAEESHILLAGETLASLPGVKKVDNNLVFDGKSQEKNSDGWISLQIKSSLLFNRNVSGINTQVFVKDGIVTLKGEAANQAQKDLAGAYSRDVSGVKDVKNEITIAKIPAEPKQTMGEKIDDASITAQVKVAFLSHHSTSAFKTGVQTNNGVVTLTGNAVNSASKDMAGKVANDVNGVTQVINNMTVDQIISKN